MQYVGIHTLRDCLDNTIPVYCKPPLSVSEFLISTPKTQINGKKIGHWPLLTLQSATPHSNEWLTTSGMLNVIGGYSVELISYFQHHLYFLDTKQSKNNYQTLLQPSLSMQERVKQREKILRLKYPIQNYCAVHVRRGDYTAYYDSAKGPLCLPCKSTDITKRNTRP